MTNNSPGTKTPRELIKQVLPPELWDRARQSWYALYRALLWPSATFHPWRRRSIRRLKGLKDIHRGRRGFIIGNGPSLNRMDLRPLRDEITFGMNRIYLMFPELGFYTSYFLSINSLVIEQCAEDIRSLPIPKFLSWRSHKVIKPTEDMIFLHTTYTGPRFAEDACTRLWEGATVTYVAMQLAFHLGLDPVILIGVDHSYASQGKPNTTIVSQGDDASHFNVDYFGMGFRWQLPDLETSEKAYRMALAAYQRAGRRIIDATVDGKLNIFPKADFSSLFN